MSRFANLADNPRISANRSGQAGGGTASLSSPPDSAAIVASSAPSRLGRKAIAGYFPPEMSLAMHVCARKHGLSLQALMAEAFDDVLRKYRESPVGV